VELWELVRLCFAARGGLVGWPAWSRGVVFFTSSRSSSAKEEALDSAVRGGGPPCSAAALFFASGFSKRLSRWRSIDRSVRVSGREFSAGGGQQRRERAVTAAVSGASQGSGYAYTPSASCEMGSVFFSISSQVFHMHAAPHSHAFGKRGMTCVFFCLVLDK